MGDFNLVKVDDPKALGKVTVSLMDKLEHACGWLATPKGAWKDQVEAKGLFIEEIKNNPNLTPLEKAAFISNSKQLIKQYKNQHDIYQIALAQLDEKAQPENIDDDWLSHFFDEAKQVSKDDVKIIWGKLLADECNSPGTVPKSLIRTLSEMSAQDAKTFELLSSFGLEYAAEIEVTFPGNVEPLNLELANTVNAFIDWNQSEYYQRKGLSFQQINELVNKRLISFDPIGGYSLTAKKAVFYYHDKKFRVEDIKNVFPAKPRITVGNLLLTDDGISLYKAIQHTEQTDFLDICKATWSKAGLKITPVSEKSEEKK